MLRATCRAVNPWASPDELTAAACLVALAAQRNTVMMLDLAQLLGDDQKRNDYDGGAVLRREEVRRGLLDWLEDGSGAAAEELNLDGVTLSDALLATVAAPAEPGT